LEAPEQAGIISGNNKLLYSEFREVSIVCGYLEFKRTANIY
jgi:hypothetical protein